MGIHKQIFKENGRINMIHKCSFYSSCVLVRIVFIQPVTSLRWLCQCVSSAPCTLTPVVNRSLLIVVSYHVAPSVVSCSPVKSDADEREVWHLGTALPKGKQYVHRQVRLRSFHWMWVSIFGSRISASWIFSLRFSSFAAITTFG